MPDAEGCILCDFIYIPFWTRETNLQGKSDDKLPGERATAKKHKEAFIKGGGPFYILILVVLTQLYTFVKNLQNYTQFMVHFTESKLYFNNFPSIKQGTEEKYV